jgi:uncharacterized membrane protein YhaH (DUF805 family)
VFGGLFAPAGAEPTYHFIVGLTAVLAVFLIVSWAAIGTKRLHDRGKSAFWLLFFYPLPAALYWYGTARQEPSVAMMAISAGLYLWGLVELGFLPGSEEDNAYGPPPGGGLTGPGDQPTLPGI